MDDSGRSSSLSKVLNRRNDNVNINLNAEVLIKSERHHNKKDLLEELELIRSNGFDTLLYEAPKSDYEEVEENSNIELIYDLITGLMLFVLRPIYTNSIPVITTALRNGATPHYTREKDANILKELSTLSIISVVCFWILLLILTAISGVMQGNVRIFTFSLPYTIVSFVSFILALATPAFIRIIRNNVSNDLNRNRIIADKIEDISDNSDHLLVVLGHKHAEKIESHLDDKIESDVIPQCELELDFNLFLNYIKVCMYAFAIWLTLVFLGETIILFII